MYGLDAATLCRGYENASQGIFERKFVYNLHFFEINHGATSIKVENIEV
jgi:hypothetical protein